MTDSIEIDDGINVEYELDYHQPAEKQTLEYPGCDEEVVFTFTISLDFDHCEDNDSYIEAMNNYLDLLGNKYPEEKIHGLITEDYIRINGE